MSVVDIFNLPGDDAQLAMWSRMHMMWHRSCNVEIERQFNIILAEYILDPISSDAIDQFLSDHQIMHNDLDAILGIASQNLQEVDWEDENQRIGWFQAHAQLTRQESDKLGISA